MNPGEEQQHHQSSAWSSFDQGFIGNLLSAHGSPPAPSSSLAPMHHSDQQQLPSMSALLFEGFTRKRHSAEERRVRHRASQHRFMQRKKDAIANTKRLVQELEQKYQLLAIEAETKRLEEANQQLAAQLGVSTPPIPTCSQIAMLLEEEMSMVRRHFEPLDVAAWTNAVKKNVREYDLSQEQMHFMTSGVSVMGWRDLRKIENETLTFVLSKEFPNMDMEDLMNRTYARLACPETHARFFSPLLIIKMQVLQRINDDNIIIHRAMFVPQTCKVVHSLEMISRVRRDEGFLVIGRALENNPVQQRLGVSYRWTDLTTWLEFLPSHRINKGSNGCVYRTGGQLRQFAARTAAYWMVEVFSMALRYESEMIAPVFCITSE